MRNSLFFFIRVFLVCVFFLSIIGCATTRSNNSLSIGDPQPFAVTAEVDKSQSIPELSDTVNDPALMIEVSKNLCKQQKYSEADSILKIAIETIGLLSSDSTSFEEYLNEILAIYTEVMPSDIQIPDDIATLAYEQRMFRSLDSFSISTDDSSFMQNLLCGKSTSYDVPIIWNERVLHAAYYYYKNRKATIDHWIRRSNQYLPIMKKLFKENNLPEDLAYLPFIESGFNPKAYSHAHASGIWQFIPSTAKIYGLRNNYWLDERRDPLKSTIAASKYLKKLYADFKDWHLALAAYNCGEGGLGRAITRSNTKNYWELTLPRETMNYVPLYLAALTIAKNPGCFSLETPSDTATFLFDTVRINECLDMKDIAAGLEISFDTLRKMNPHILHWCTPPDLSNVLLYLPCGYAQAFYNFQATIPDSKKVKWYRYKIKHGDNIGSIASHFKISAEPIKSINRLKNNKIIAGKYLFIPIPVSRSSTEDILEQNVIKSRTIPQETVTSKGRKVLYKVKPGDSVWRISEIFNISPGQICAWNQLGDAAEISAGQLLTIYQPENSSDEKEIQDRLQEGQSQYQVQRGDTPASVARKFGMKIEELISLNNLDGKKPIIYSNDILIVRKSKEKESRGSNAHSNSTYMKYQVSASETLYGISRIFSVPVQQLREINNLTESSVIKAGDTLLIPTIVPNKTLNLAESPVVFYEVKQGDNLWRIANSFGISIQSLYEQNNLNPDSVLMPGDTIKVIKTGDM